MIGVTVGETAGGPSALPPLHAHEPTFMTSCFCFAFASKIFRRDHFSGLLYRLLSARLGM
jgi:hypothetical protein